jgi:SAM-dependent methyltransferase
VTGGPGPTAARESRERRFWDDHVESVHECLDQYAGGPDANTRAMLDALEPLAGARVLDLGCGSGAVTAWLAARGADVTALDLSPASIECTRNVLETLGLPVRAVCDSFPSASLETGSFDRIAGRYVLHHLDLRIVGPALAELLRPGGRAAFVETMQTNPLLGLARRRLVGRLGVPRYGTLDESPLSRGDLALLAGAVGPVSTDVAQMIFLRLVDRQLLGFRHAGVSKALGALDDALLALRLKAASYHQVVVLEKRQPT